MTSWNATLDNLLLEALHCTWSCCNDDYFSGVLLAPVLVLEDTRTRLGQWQNHTRILSISRPLVRERAWSTVREVLKHEMAHQYVDEVLGVRDETAHGPRFLHVCSTRHIDARATGSVEESDDAGTPALDADGDRVMRRVQKLLALASSSNPHEAEAAANTAQRLMLEHNIAARKQGARGYLTRALSPPTLRLHTYERILAGVLAERFFVRIIFASAYLPELGRYGQFVEASGTPENLAMAEWIFTFLRSAAERAYRAQHKTGVVAGKDRSRFLTGFMLGVVEKLRREATKANAEGLVWLGDPDLETYVRQQHPRLVASRRSHITTNEAFGMGRDAGNQVVISRPIADAPTERGRLLSS